MPLPIIGDATCVRTHDLGSHIVGLLTDIENIGLVEYLFVMPVVRKSDKSTTMVVTSEANRMASLGGGSHFLCAFLGGEHVNYGCSDAWADIERFEAAALEKIRASLEYGFDA